MIRAAVAADLPRLLAIRDAAGADALSDPTLLSEEGLRRLIDAGTVEVWDEAAYRGYWTDKEPEFQEAAEELGKIITL